MTEPFNLINEFPELKEKILEMKHNNHHFQKLLAEYADVDHLVSRSEKRLELLSEEVEEQARRKRLHLKDQLYAMLNTGKK